MGALNGLHVVITRPTGQADSICQLCREAGATVFHLPLIAIQELTDHSGAQTKLARANDYDLLIFISANAVHYGASLITTYQGKIAAIGKKTAELVGKQGLQVDYQPSQGFTSEDLLALPELQSVAGQKVLIVRGEGGREQLAKVLSERGASVDYAAVYRRVCPDAARAVLLKHQHATQPIDIIQITSSEGLKNLLTLLDDVDGLRQIALLVGSQRIADDAHEQGFTGDIVVADDPGDLSMFSALMDWQQS